MLRSVIASALIVAFSLGAPNRAAADDVKAAKAHYKQGIAFGNDGKFEEAARHYEKVLEFAPDNRHAFERLREIYGAKGAWK